MAVPSDRYVNRNLFTLYARCAGLKPLYAFLQAQLRVFGPSTTPSVAPKAFLFINGHIVVSVSESDRVLDVE